MQFVVANPNRLPGVNVKKLNAQFLIAAVIKLQEQIQSQDATVFALKEQFKTYCNNNNNYTYIKL